MVEDSDISKRVEKFRRNPDLENFLKQLNSLLAPAQQAYFDRAESSAETHPLVFVMGPPRSGTTLLMQWLAAGGVCACPTNVLSRFYGAPVIGALIQQLLTDEKYNFRNELQEFSRPIEYSSENGKTSGILAPNEFWHFWRRFLPFGDLDWLPDGQLLEEVDTQGLVKELSALSTVFDKPFALKAMILNYNVGFLDAIFRRALFIQIRRDPVANVASLMAARKRQYGDESFWYSFKIPEYPQLSQLDPVRQSAGQVIAINQALERGISQVDDARKLVVSYETFCEDPASVHIQLLDKLGLVSDNFPYQGPRQFKSKSKVGRDVASRIQRALDTAAH